MNLIEWEFCFFLQLAFQQVVEVQNITSIEIQN